MLFKQAYRVCFDVLSSVSWTMCVRLTIEIISNERRCYQGQTALPRRMTANP